MVTHCCRFLPLNCVCCYYLLPCYPVVYYGCIALVGQTLIVYLRLLTLLLLFTTPRLRCCCCLLLPLRLCYVCVTLRYCLVVDLLPLPLLLPVAVVIVDCLYPRCLRYVTYIAVLLFTPLIAVTFVIALPHLPRYVMPLRLRLLRLIVVVEFCCVDFILRVASYAACYVGFVVRYVVAVLFTVRSLLVDLPHTFDLFAVPAFPVYVTCP